ncbi:MAG: helix-turn-helix transcriptional regulator [Oscillatoria sp. SIO1A7]|nr:helix-turn-helix transcriptional regulator [Oscillatoria sp. SIO1A7]
MGKIIAKARREKGLTQFQLAGAIGIGRNKISLVENGHVRAESDLLHWLSKCLDLDLNVLLALAQRLPDKHLEERQKLTRDNALLQQKVLELESQLLKVKQQKKQVILKMEEIKTALLDLQSKL